jgi:antirestriction protein ArdC
MDVYQIVTDRIINLLEQGTVPWRKPWTTVNAMPKNLITGKEYRGINVFLLGCQQYSSPYWLTYKQAEEKNGTVRKGEKASLVVFWKLLDSDSIKMPYEERFERSEEFYSVLFHELAHSTGHQKRLARKEVMERYEFGSESYGTEELVAELTSSMLCGVAGISNQTIDLAASYIDGWLNLIKKDKKLIVMAAAQAQKAADYILNCKFGEECN